MSLLKRFSAAIVAVSVFSALVPLNSFAKEDPLVSESGEVLFVRAETYYEYLQKYLENPRPDVEIPLEFVSSEDGAETSVEKFEEKEDVLVWSNESGRLNFSVEVPETGLYNMKMSYFQIVGNASTTEFSVLIDGETPFDSAARVNIPRIWKSKYNISVDAKDNEIRPPQVEDPCWTGTSFKDEDGLFNDPLLFYLEKGTHEISIESERAMVAIEEISLYNEKSFPVYEAPSAEDLAMNAGAEPIRIQGEHYLYTNSQSLFPTYSRGEYLTEPSNPTKQRYNTVGDGTWERSGQMITWDFNVSEDGYYRLNVKGRQNALRGLYSNRRVYIDGAVPCEELSQVKFYYDDDWSSIVPKDENGEDIYVYLEQGKHTITLEAIPGEIGESMSNLDYIIYEANQYYMQILMITGPTPDKYTDYFVHKEIPELLDVFQKLSDGLKAERDKIDNLSMSKGSEAGALDRLATILDKCIERPNRIEEYILSNSLKDNISAVSSWSRVYRTQPLEIDYIELAPADVEFTSVKKNIFKDLAFSTEALIGSFFEDYTVLSDVTEDSINVWVGIGRDQTNVIKQMTESQFTPEYGIDVSINLVQGAIMEAVLAGKGPDVALFIGGEFPVNLAVRDLLVPVNGMDGFDEVKSRFQENAMVQYSYNGDVYGVPLTQTFPMMFYRKDILAETGIAYPPETWDELIDILPALQRNYMQPGLFLPGVVNGAVTNVISPATEPGHTFAILMLQSGMGYYNEEQTMTTFDSQTAVEAFTTWTDFYNIYKFDQVYDAFTRFRTGEAPIVIQNYCQFYNQLNTAAPELKGLWDFTSIPGTVLEDGTISHAANSTGSGAIILSDCKNVDSAWEFIKWFSSTDVMVEYAQNVEGVLGPLGRVDSANVESIARLNWSKDDLDKIYAQMDELEEIPIVPSAYDVTRSLINAFRAVVNDKENPRDTLRLYNIDINNEIERKRNNLGLND